MIRFLSLPCGPRSAPYRVLVEITGISIHPATTPVLAPYQSLHKCDRERFLTDEAYAEYLSTWQADEIRRMGEYRARATQLADGSYRNTVTVRGWGEDTDNCWTHATPAEIESALVNATGPIAIVNHAYPTEPA